MEINALPSLDSLLKDELYYFDDGNQVFQVGNNLFKLHGSILRMHSNFYRNMYALPQAADKGPNAANGEPIVCDDDPEAFRALCWALYADPLETGKEREITAKNVKKIAHIGLLAHKYEFPNIEQWTISICENLPPPEVLVEFQVEDLKYLTHVIYHCDWREVRNDLTKRLRDGVATEKNTTAIATGSTLSNAIQAAIHVGDISLQALLYYCYLSGAGWDLHLGERQKRKLGLRIDGVTDWTSIVPLSSLTSSQKLNLFQGFSLIQTFRNRLRYMPIMDPFPTSCDTSDWWSCQTRWNSWWASQAQKLDGLVNLDGPLEFLSTMIRRAADEPPDLVGHKGSETKECIEHVVGQLRELRTAFAHDLQNCFKDSE